MLGRNPESNLIHKENIAKGIGEPPKEKAVLKRTGDVMRRTGETKKTPWGKMEDKKSEEAKLKASGVDKEGVDGFVKGLREDEANVMDNLNNLFREDGKKDSGQA